MNVDEDFRDIGLDIEIILDILLSNKMKIK